MSDIRANSQDIRPLKIIILNLMPKKIETETQFMRLLSNTPLQVDVELLHVKSHRAKHTSENHLSSFYRTFDEIKNNFYDGLIITGAPVEHLEFEQVDYWQELCKIMEWSKSNVFSTMHICWGACAGLYYHFGIPKYPLEKKMFGIFPHNIERVNSQLLKGFDASSDIAGVHIVANKNGRQYFIMGHSEYDRNTLAEEYFRDVQKGMDIQMPYNYFPNDDTSKQPVFKWRCHANLMYSNWLNYCVYQRTPFNLEDLKEMVTSFL